MMMNEETLGAQDIVRLCLLCLRLPSYDLILSELSTIVVRLVRGKSKEAIMASSNIPTVPEAHITRPDEPKSSSNGGLNIALVVTVVLSIACVIWAALAVPHWNFNGDSTRPENIRQNANPTNPNSLSPGTTGAVMPNKGNEHDMGNKSYLNGQQIQGDTITSGPGASPGNPEGSNKTLGSDRGGVEIKSVPNNSKQNQ